MTANGSPVVTERFTEPGCQVTCFRDPNNENPKSLALFKGGLSDIRSSSGGELMHAVLEASEGELAVGLVRTIRPLMLHKAIMDSIFARERRAESTENAIVGGQDFYPDIDSIMVIGQSEGGVSAVDGVTRVLENPNAKKRLKNVRKTVLTMETPGVYGPIDYEGNTAQGLGRLILNCAGDVKKMTNTERMRMFTDATKRGMSPFEILHILGEISYLKDIDISGDIGGLRGQNVGVYHTFRDEDEVDGAEIDSEYSTVFSGSHLGSLHGEGARETAEHIVYIHNNPEPVPETLEQAA